MKNLIILLFVSLAFGATAQDTAIKDYGKADKKTKKGIDEALVSYLKVKDALVATNKAEAQTAAAELKTAIESIPADKLTEEQKQYLDEHCTSIVRQSASIQNDSFDIEQKRAAFEKITQSMYALIKSFKANKVEVYLQYCPMAMDGNGAFWLSDKGTIMNPYFGDLMLHCGDVEEVIE